MEHYEYTRYLGEGGNADVLEAVDKRNGEMVAIKKFRRMVSNGTDVLKILEVKVMQLLNGHPNVLTLKEAVIEEAMPHIILELMEKNVLDRIMLGVINVPEIRSISWQMLKGIAHIHSCGYLHNDLKPENLLLNNQNVLKICDFGSARPYSTDIPRLDTRLGTCWYSAPEAIDAALHGGYGPPADLWSAGCIIAELCTRIALFRGENHDHQLSVITDVLGCERYINLEQKLQGAPAALTDLIVKLLNPDPTKRPTAVEALKHRFFDPYQRTLPSDRKECSLAALPGHALVI